MTDCDDSCPSPQGRPCPQFTGTSIACQSPAQTLKTSNNAKHLDPNRDRRKEQCQRCQSYRLLDEIADHDKPPLWNERGIMFPFCSQSQAPILAAVERNLSLSTSGKKPLANRFVTKNSPRKVPERAKLVFVVAFPFCLLSRSAIATEDGYEKTRSHVDSRCLRPGNDGRYSQRTDPIARRRQPSRPTPQRYAPRYASRLQRYLGAVVPAGTRPGLPLGTLLVPSVLLSP